MKSGAPVAAQYGEMDNASGKLSDRATTAVSLAAPAFLAASRSSLAVSKRSTPPILCTDGTIARMSDSTLLAREFL